MTEFQRDVVPCRALLVDANKTCIDLWRAAVRPHEDEIHASVVPNLEEACSLAEKDGFNIVFIDVGPGAEEGIRRLMGILGAREKQTFFVLVTDKESLEMIQWAHEMGLDDFIVKGPLYREEVTLHLTSFIERYRLQEALETSVESYRDLFEMNPLPLLVVLAESGKIAIANYSAQRLLGREVEHLENSVLSDWFENLDGEQARFLNDAEEVRAVTMIDPLTLKSGGVEGQKLRGRFQSFQFGLVRAFQLTIEDVSKLEREAESIGYLNVRETEAEKLAAVGQILSKVAHEINNPMSVIMGLTLLLMEDPNLKEYLSDFQTLQRSAERCNTVLQDILRFTRMQGISSETVVIDELVKEVTDRFSPQCDAQGIVLKVEQGAAGEVVSGDPFLLEHVLVAIMTNAQEAIIRGNRGSQITLQTRVASGKVQIDVSNDGPEIPDNLWGQIFAPFYTTKQKGDGVGLSMFYCYGVINEHFGNLTLERSDEEGTTFRIVLPQGDQGIVTIEESERFSQATPARIGVVLIPENSAKHLKGIQLRLQNDPTLEIHVVQTEDGLLDATASLQPELIVVHGEHLEAPESTITALKGLLFRGTPEIFVFREESDDICAPPDTIVWEGQLPREEESFFDALLSRRAEST